jgi:hypothetical protein
MAKYTHGKTKGTSDRKSSRRLSSLSGTTNPIKEYNIKHGAGAVPQFKTITSDYYESQPLAVPGPVQIPDAPEIPDDSQNLRNLATALGDVNTKLNQFIPGFWDFQESMDKAAREEAERQAVQNDANSRLNQAKDTLERKGATDPDAKAAYGIFASMDQRVERELSVVTARNKGLTSIGNLNEYALQIYNESLNDPTRIDKDSGAVVPLNPSTQEFTNLLLNKLKTDIDNPQAYLELQETAQAAIINARANVAKIHADYKDTTSVNTLKLNLGNTILTAKSASDQTLSTLNFTDNFNHFRLKSGSSISNYQTYTEPLKLLELIADATVSHSNRTDLAEISDKTLTMLLNTRLGAGEGQLLSEMLGGEEVLKKWWETAISTSRNEAYRQNDLARITQAEDQADAIALKFIGMARDADLTVDGIQEFGTHTTYNIKIDGEIVPYQVKNPPNATNLQGIISKFRQETKNAYKIFDTGAEILAYQNQLNDQLQGWLRTVGIEDQNANEASLRELIRSGINPAKTEALILHFAKEGWITTDQKTLLLQNSTQQRQLETQRTNFEITMKEPYKNIELKLTTLFQQLDDDNDLEPEKWTIENQTLFRSEINNFKQKAETIFNSLNDDTYAERIEKIKIEEKNLLKKIDEYIEQAKNGENPYEVQNQNEFQNRISGTTNNETDDKNNITESNLLETNNTGKEITTTPEVISKEAYALLSYEEQRKYEPVPRTGKDRLEPGGGYIKEYKLIESERILISNDPNKYSDKTLKDYFKINKIKGGRGDDRQNIALRQEILTTAIYNQTELIEQANRLEQLLEYFPEGINEKEWNKLPYNLNTRQKIYREIDFKSIQTLLRRTKLTPRQFFETQMHLHGLEIPTELFDKLFPESKWQSIQVQNQSNSEKLQSSSPFSVDNLYNQEIAQVASTDLKGILKEEVIPPRIDPSENPDLYPDGIETGSYVLPKDVTDDKEFVLAVEKLSTELDIPVNYLWAVMGFETGGTYDPGQYNIGKDGTKESGSGAVGLIQFMPATLEEWGVTTEEAANMTRVEQLELVAKHLRRWTRPGDDFRDVYMSILFPVAAGKPNDYVLFTKGTKEKPNARYDQNIGLDKNGDGIITKEEAASSILQYLPPLPVKEVPKEQDSSTISERSNIA